MYKLYCRLYQGIMRLVAYLLPWRTPELIEGQESFKKLIEVLEKDMIEKVLIVTDAGLVERGLLDEMFKSLNADGMEYVLYDGTIPNPTTGNIEDAYEMYVENNCEAIIAFGGGSPMDCAKGVGARVANPNKSITQMKGVLRVRNKLPLLIAIPTTAGTGSEATLAAVISDADSHIKYQVNDPVLIPDYAILDQTLTTGLPPHITSATGIDALTHAVEAYIGQSNTKSTKRLAKKAVRLVFNHIYTAYTNGNDKIARLSMLRGAHYAGVAFTRAYVGYVHGIAHALGGQYNLPHGLAISIVLPHMLEYYGASIHVQLAELADAADIGKGLEEEEKAQAFIAKIKELNTSMEIPGNVKELKERDIPELTKQILKESNPFYPVPKILGKKDMDTILRSLLA